MKYKLKCKHLTQQKFVVKYNLAPLSIILIALVALFACSTPGKTPQISKIPQTLNNSKPNNTVVIDNNKYKKQWQKVDSLEKKQLPKSAAEIVNEIYAQAKEDNNAPQRVKALIHQLKYITILEEVEQPVLMQRLEDEIAANEAPVTNILHSMLAEAYWQYFQNNRYRFYNRTETVSFNNEDILTWSLPQIFDKIISQHQLALQNEDRLKQIPVEQFEDIIDLADRTKNGNPRPTLFDFIANRAVDFYSHDESSINKPVYEFQLVDDAIFQSSQDFIQHTFEAQEQTSLKLAAVKTFQQLEAFHQNDEDKLPLILSILKRIKFAYQKAVYDNKSSDYEKALEQLINQYKNDTIHTLVSYTLAEHLLNKEKNSSIKHNDINYIKRAWQTCTDAVTAFPDSKGTQNCNVIIGGIEAKTLQFEIEEVNVPNKPFRALLSYKNLDRIYLKVVKVDYDLSHDFRLGSTRKGMETMQEWELDIPDPKDYYTHNLEFKIEPLEAGHYFLFISDSPNYSRRGYVNVYKSFWVSNMSIVKRSTPYSNKEVFVIDRNSGEPIANVACKVFQKYRDKYEWKTKFIDSVYTNENGLAVYPDIDMEHRNGDIVVKLKKGDNEYMYKDRAYNFSARNERKPVPFTKTNLFTDRSIYRPGQTVYFKGLVYNYNDGKSSIKANEEIKVTLHDVNRQLIASETFITNEFGSFNGSFTLPQTGLTGKFRLGGGNATNYINVEEYKRSRFEVNFNKIEGSYALNDSVVVTGKANSYAGAALDNVEVEYEVSRSYYLPYICYWWNWSRPTVSQWTIINNGKTKTDENGNFNINFEALPDLAISKDLKPIFNYYIHAKIIDSTGETQECNTTVKAGYVALEVAMNFSESIEKQDSFSISINTKNLNGTFEPADINVSIRKIEQSERPLKERFWNEPDQFIISKKDYVKDFPYDVYANENLLKNRQKGSLLKSIKQTTTKDLIIEIPEIKNWAAGDYEVILNTKDKNGSAIEIASLFKLHDLKSKTSTTNKICSFKVLKKTVEVGDTAKIIIETKNKNVKVYYTLVHQGNFEEDEVVEISEEQKIINIPVKEKLRGNFTINLIAVKHNRVFSLSEYITVPFPSRKLDMEFLTFRDKLKPNQAEQWKIKIRGPEGEMVAAEMLAAMYDASLDVFTPHSWSFKVVEKTDRTYQLFSNVGFSKKESEHSSLNLGNSGRIFNRHYDRLNWFGFSMWYSMGMARALYSNPPGAAPMMRSKAARQALAPQAMDMIEVEEEASYMMADSEVSDNSNDGRDGMNEQASNQKDNIKNVSPRTNLNETAFFMPELQTDQEGNVIIAFDAPEALTRWKFLGFGHTQDLNYGQIENEMTTQKELMITPNAPRFFRAGDQLTFTGKVNNLSDKSLQGEAVLELYDALTMQPIDNKFAKQSKPLSFTAEAGRSEDFKWTLNIPDDVEAVTYKILAKSGQYSDGEQNSLPVLKNTMLVTETMPLPVRAKQSQNFVFGKMQNHGSSTLKHHSYTLEFTSNPAWYAVQALPYLMEYPHDCAEQIFSRVYANSLASHIANANPKIQQIFNSWKEEDSEELVSNLEKNQQLKSLLLEETPWVLQANNETERKKRVALLFDLNKMSGEYASNVNKLLEMQLPSGAFPWFNGMRENRYITQHIVTGFAKLDKLGVDEIRTNNRLWNKVRQAVLFLDERLKKDYEDLKKRKDVDLTKNHTGNIQVHYLYMRSFFRDIEIPNNVQKAYDYYKGQAAQYWTDFSIYQKGLIGLALNRYGNDAVPNDIIKSLKEFALEDEEMGKYFKYDRGYYWHQAPIETQALMIELFEEVAQDADMVDGLKTWLLKQKQTQDWKTTKATVEAIYALLLRGDDWLADTQLTKIEIGGRQIKPSAKTVNEGTGHFQKSWAADEVINEMAEVKVTNPNEHVTWGAVYWQYFEALDKITFAETPLSLKKQLFKEIKTDTGKKIEPLDEEAILKPGDKVVVKIELRVDRAMDYVHMKDMRAACFEPVNVISQYKYQDGLGYYESTKDASTNFFMDRLKPGTYVFEYPLKVYHSGDFSNGITSIQCMYAPEFASHSAGVRVKVE